MSVDVYAIIGPTASGKTALSLKMARELNGEIISVDSRQIYVGMDIGTAKEKKRPNFSENDYTEIWKKPFEIQGVPHYLIDICLPSDNYTAFDFKEQATFLIEDMLKRGVTPILAGGTGLYFNTLLFNYQAGEDSMSKEISEELNKRYEQGEQQVLWNELNAVDPEGAEAIHPNNSRYLVRALEYYLVTGRPKSTSIKKNPTPIYNTKFIGLNWPREKLYERINLRIDQQMEAGLLEETKELLSKYPVDLPAMSSLGYLELTKYINGKLSLDEALELFKRNTRRYAKRQLTWFRKYSDIEWVDQV